MQSEYRKTVTSGEAWYQWQSIHVIKYFKYFHIFYVFCFWKIDHLVASWQILLLPFACLPYVLGSRFKVKRWKRGSVYLATNIRGCNEGLLGFRSNSLRQKSCSYVSTQYFFLDHIITYNLNKIKMINRCDWNCQ